MQIFADITKGVATFLPLEQTPEGKYMIKKFNVYQIRLLHIQNNEWSISILSSSPENYVSDGILYPKTTWLRSELLAKLAKWSTEIVKNEFKSTLSCISVAKYSRIYQDLKEKYKEIVKVWPEVTNPEKFVYEDVAIAAYLLILWEDERAERGLSKKQSFVDLGCGNGLLVHILSNEGHPGKGIDVRRRRIWDMYGPNTCLEVCLIGMSRTYLTTQENILEEQRAEYIKRRRLCSITTQEKMDSLCQDDNILAESDAPGLVADDEVSKEIYMEKNLISGFLPRSKEQMRNCTTLPQDFVDSVVLKVANLLLNETKESPLGNSSTWNKGVSLALGEIAEHLDKETLKILKNEYGGLQTLLRNNHQVFEVLNGKVHIRDWREGEPLRKNRPGNQVKQRLPSKAFKTRLCWFYIHHPHGCPLNSELCRYAHGTEELKPSLLMPRKNKAKLKNC
ncbi:hypothetical protein JD844_027351 [Phrynosoma platyrhinos]|uniref:tRNA (uracil-O(2)-)-methyltransferase n=1 Tax=Phrynosoma platyrhinos TaxID=52577 RepID=A0ABQ7SGB5_PHRPL|nr:hypothetical protein JD844_027351 [Phrynosoma platyrhinos]